MNELISNIIQHIGKLFKWWVIILPWEQGIRVRFGKQEKILKAGTYFRIPYFDTVVVRSNRMRVVSLSVQTVQTKDGHTLSILLSCGYAITDIVKMYRTLYHPDATIGTMVQASASEYITQSKLSEISPDAIQEHIQKKVNAELYGIGKFQANVIGYAMVKTYRLIQDHSWTPVDSSDDEKNAMR